MQRRAQTYAVPLIFIAASLARADVPLTLSRAIAEAQANSPTVQKSEDQLHAASWSRLEALSESLPQIQLAGQEVIAAQYMNLGINFGGSAITFPSAFPQTTLTVQGSLLLFDGMVALDRYLGAQRDYEASELLSTRARFMLEKEVEIRFDEALAARELAKVAELNIKTLEDHLSIAHVSARAGYATRFDVLRIQAQLEEARAQKVLEDDNVALARKALADTMGEQSDTSPLEGTLAKPNADVVPKSLQPATAREDVLAQELHESAESYRDSAAARFWVPKVSMFGMYQFYSFGDFAPGVIIPTTGFPSTYSVGFNLTWNLFDGGASIARSKITAARADSSLQDTRAVVLKASEDFETWKRRFFYNVALYHARTRSVEESEESVRLATAGLRAGTRTHTEVLDAELDLFRSRAGLIRAQADALEALANLELATGTRFEGQTAR